MHRLPTVVSVIAGAAITLGVASPASLIGKDVLPARSITTTGRVLQLAADGTTVAAVVGSTRTACARVVIWDVRHAAPMVTETKSDCPSSQRDVDGLDDVAVGDGMVGVIRSGGGHTVERILSVTRLPATGHWTDVTGTYAYEYAAGEGDYLSVLGDGRVLAFAKWSVCYVYNKGETCPGIAEGGGWWESDGRLVQVLAVRSTPGSQRCPGLSGKDPNLMGIPWGLSPVNACRKIASGTSVLGAVALDRGRFVLLPPHGRVTIVAAKNGHVTELPIRTDTIAQAFLDGPNLLIRHKQGTEIPRLAIHDVASGALRGTVPLARATVKANLVRIESAHDGLAVYLIGTTIHVLSLADGKSHAIPIPIGAGPVRARLEDAGLTYSFNRVATPAHPGRVEFVPLARLAAQLH